MTDAKNDPQTVEKPEGPPPDEGMAYDPEMTDTDEANIPPESNADPGATPGATGATDAGPAADGD